MHFSEDKEGKIRLRTLIIVCGSIILVNFAIGCFTPTTVSLNDEIGFFDLLWRVAQGQQLGIDYHDPLGFGPFEVGALLWHGLGPHNTIMRLSIALFSISIGLCGCIVARRSLNDRRDLALLFCITLAFQLSAPTVYPDSAQFGLMEFYNRLSASVLAVLFLHTFGDQLSSVKALNNRREIVITVVLNAFLLNMLFMTKISGFLLGIFIVSIGCVVQTRVVPTLLILFASIVTFGALTALEFKCAELDYIAVVREYVVAARARATYSVRDVVQGIFNGPFIISNILLLLFGLLQRSSPAALTREFGIRVSIIGCYAGCQFALNLTNSGPPTMWLAPAAIVSLVIWSGTKGTFSATRQLINWRQRFDPYLLADVSVRDATPYIIFALFLFRQVVGSILGAGVAASITLGIIVPYVISAERGTSLWVYPGGAYEKSLNDAVNAITTLRLDRKVIATLDYSNPFPALFLAPSPKGTYAAFSWGYFIPYNAVLTWYDVIGDACVVTVPAVPFYSGVTRRLLNVVQSKLESDFQLVYQDASWSIYYKRSHDCRIEPLRPL